MSRLHEISGCKDVQRKADVIFVHGLGGDPFTTWKSVENASWPHWLGEDVPEVGVWSLGYAASPIKWTRFLPWIGRGDRDSGHAMALPDRAAQVLDQLVMDGFGERPIFFICHSLGGLLVKQILRTARDSPDARRRRVTEQTRAVLFLATPHAGASLASFVDRFRAVLGSTVSIEDLKAHDAHLRELLNWYRNHSPTLGITTRTYFELRSVGSALPIVNATSAHPGVGEDPVGLDEDHLSIAKPRSRKDQTYRAALDLLRRHVLASGPPFEVLPPAEPPHQAAQAPSTATFPIPRQLPPAAEKFFGRPAELRKLAERLRAGKSTAVVGPPGLGKTALAAEALCGIVGDRCDQLATSPFPDGVVFLDLYAWQGQAEPAWNTLASLLAGGDFLERFPARDRAVEACRGRHLLVIVEGGEEATGEGGRAGIATLLEVLSPENRWLLLTRDSSQAAAADSVKLRDALDPTDAAQLLDAHSEMPLVGPLRDRVLDLLQGHPLALTWAANLLASGDEPARLLVEDWEKDPLLGLKDPTRAEHSLHWLFKRSERDLDEATKDVLEAAGLLAHTPFPLELIESVVSPEQARASLRTLVQRGFLRLVDQDERWQFGHVLAYRFARVEKGSDPQLRERLATALWNSLENALDSGHLDSVARALGHATALLRTDEEERLWSLLGHCLLYKACNRLRELGHLPLVQGALIAVRGWFDRLTAEGAQKESWKGALGVLLNREGDLKMAQGDLDEALSAYRQSLGIAQALVAGDRSNPSWQRGLSVSHVKIANVLEDLEKLEAALDSLEVALQIDQNLASFDPSNSEFQHDLSVSYNRVGDILRKQGKHAESLLRFESSLEIRQKLASAEPSDPQWKRELSSSYNKIGESAEMRGDLDGAISMYRQAREIRKRLVLADPSNAMWLRDLSFTSYKLALLNERLGERMEALLQAEESLSIDEKLAALDPTNATWQNDLKDSRELFERLRQV